MTASSPRMSSIGTCLWSGGPGSPASPRWRLAVTMITRNPYLAPPSGQDFEAERRRRKEATEKRRADAQALVDDEVAAAAAA